MRISTPKAFRIDMLIIFNATPVSIYPSDDKKTKNRCFIITESQSETTALVVCCVSVKMAG